MPYYIIGKWFGWYWDKRELNLLAKVLVEGTKCVSMGKEDKHRFKSVISRIRKMAREG